MKRIIQIGLFFVLPLTTIGQENKNLVILRKGQKIFLERGDFMKDKIYAVTDKTDTVEVILADKSFYKFKKGNFEAWAITNQLDESSDILGKQSVVVYPFMIRLDKVTTVYKEGKLGADKMQDLKKGQKIKVNSKSGYFYEVQFDGMIAYAHITTIAEPKTHYHIMKSIFDKMNDQLTYEINENYIRSNGKLISRYQSGDYSSDTFKDWEYVLLNNNLQWKDRNIFICKLLKDMKKL